MDNFEEKSEPRHNILAGLFLVVAGSLFLASKMGVPMPYWLFTWPVLLITIGVFVGIKKGFRDFSWIILIIVGGLFLAEKMNFAFHVREYILPIVIIIIGVGFMLKPKRFNKHNCRNDRWRKHWEEKRKQHFEGKYQFENAAAVEKEAIFTEKKNSTEPVDSSEQLDAVAVFGAVRKKVVSKNFAGGEVVCFMGGAEIDLSQADIQGPVILDITQVFGGTKLIVPSHWDLKAEMAAVFGGVEDKRVLHGKSVDLNKVVILRGTSVFGGIDIQSY
ncbi:putative membrane protein [Filimonas zeae]|uniref:Membrane protein n=1 Tax=Filimonas zeae TaxID=1737353 RepID=A0A917IY19_9BACT|nr:DUF5668 domain-containing protein [Filimonas zeae]MDR6338571.1 putative membrane protein [Filimonas zeae]GGH67609.1 membrane protein [Filimonas zeae]